MSYEKQTWETGEVITASKLNHMEDGIAGNGALLLTLVEREGTVYHDLYVYDATTGEPVNPATGTVLFNALLEGRAIYLLGNWTSMAVNFIPMNDGDGMYISEIAFYSEIHCQGGTADTAPYVNLDL